MNCKQLEEFRSLLEDELARISETARTHLDQLNQMQESDLTDHEYQSTDLKDAEVESRIVGSEVNLAGKIQRALERIEDGSYGICEGCGQPIPPERLRVKPSVTLCVPCQEAKEG